MKTRVMFKTLQNEAPVLSPHEIVTASHWVQHLRECVQMGVSLPALIEKERIARLFIRSLTLAPA